MRYKILILLMFIACISKGQGFPSTDSLHRYTNRFITNSAINAFTDYRMNTELHGIINWIDSARLGTGGSVGMDTAYMINDSTFRYRKNSIFHNFTIRGVGSTLIGQNGITISGGIASQGGNLNTSITTINGRNTYSLIYDSMASWIVRNAPGTTNINFNYADPSITLNATSSAWFRVRPDGLAGFSTNGSFLMSSDSFNLTHATLLTLNSPSIKIRNIGSSSDTTTYKPLGRAADGTLKSMTSWFGGSGFGGTPDTLANPCCTPDTLLMQPGTHRFLLRAPVSSSSVTITPSDTTLVFDLSNTITGGSCTNCNLTYDAKGRLTAAANGTGGGNTNSNIGSGYRLAVPGTNNIKTVFAGGGIAIDSTSNTNGLTISSVGNPTVFNFLDHSGINDGIFVAYGATTTASSTTITCTKCTFTAGDVGKSFRMDSAGTSGHALVSTFASFIDSHHMVSTLAAGTSMTYDIVYGTDNTTAMQNLLNTVFAAGGGVIYMPSGIYVFSGPLQTNVGGVNPNCVVFLPGASLSDTTFNVRTVITLQGATAPDFLISYGADSIISHKGTVLECITEGSGNAPALFGTLTPSGGGGAGLNYNVFNFTSLKIIIPQNRGNGGPNIGAINCFNSVLQLNQFVGTIEHNLHNASQPTNEIAMVISNQIGSETLTDAQNSMVAGSKYGAAFSDHFYGQNFQTFGCYYGLVALANSYISGGSKISINWSAHNIYFPKSTLFGVASPGIAFFNIDALESELITSPGNYPTWLQNIDFVSDSSNNGSGKINYQTNHNNVISKQGGLNIIMTLLGQFGDLPTPTTRRFILGDASTVGDTLRIVSSVNGSNPSIQLVNTNSGSNAINDISIFNDVGTSTTNGMRLGLLGSNQGAPFGSAFRLYNFSGPLYFGASNTRVAFASSAGWQFGTNAVAPAASAFIDITSTTQGFLEPRMTTTQKNAISSPAEGLMVYDNTLHLPYFHNGTSWTALGQNISNADLTMQANHSVSGAGFELDLGTTGSKLSSFVAEASSVIAIETSSSLKLTGTLLYARQAGTDANTTMTDGVTYLRLPVITANRTVTLPSNGDGRTVQVINNNTSNSFSWTFATTVKDLQGNTVTDLGNNCDYTLVSDGTNWIIYGIQNNYIVNSSAGTLTLRGVNADYNFNGTTSTWTLPALANNTGVTYYIKNLGSGNITLNSNAGGNDIYDASAVNTLTIAAGTAKIIKNNGTFWMVE